jgi:uncharacterized protein YjbI with pentapeptide repeats
LLGIYVARRANQGDEKFAVIRQLGLALSALGGTNFWGANLTEARFTDATLKSANFTEATLTRTHFTGARQLNKAKPDKTYLANFPLLALLTDPNSGYQADLAGLDLRGAFLAHANLTNANLRHTDLANADLSGAELRSANLREANCIGTNFTRAHLTGACLEAWNIDHSTIFEQVDCQHVFLLETENAQGSRERRPHDPGANFEPGDFEKLFSEATNLVELLIRDGLDPQAFGATFQELIDKFGVTFADVQSIEKKGNDVLVTVAVPDDTDKADFERTALRSYDEKFAKLTAERDAARLEAGEHKQRADTLQTSILQIATNLSSNSPTIHLNNQNQALNQEDKRQIDTSGGQYRETTVSDRAQHAERDINNEAAQNTSQDDVTEPKE